MPQPGALYSVYTTRGVKVNEPCVRRARGGFVGATTGTRYPAATHYARPRLLARIIRAQTNDHTGMVHLAEADARARRQRFVGCVVTVEAAHHYGEHQVYYSPDVSDYFSDEEVTLLPTP